MKLSFYYILLAIFMLVATKNAAAQEIPLLLKEAQNLERQQKEPEALAKYQQILGLDANHYKSLIRTAELNAAIGGRQVDKKAKRPYYEAAYSFAYQAMKADSTHADGYYAMAMMSGKMTEIETENKKVVTYVRDTKVYADMALAINPNHAKANYILGKWHFEMVTLSGFKKTAVKLFYGGLPNGSIEKAIEYMEKCRSIDEYFVLNYLDLAKVYKYDNKPAQAIEVLNKLIKLPTRTFDDVAYKSEGKRILDGEMQ